MGFQSAAARCMTFILVCLSLNGCHKCKRGGDSAPTETAISPAVEIGTPEARKDGTVRIPFLLRTPADDSRAIRAEFAEGDGEFRPATLISAISHTVGLGSNAQGAPHEVVWNALGDGQIRSSVRIRISDHEGNTATSTPVPLDYESNSAPTADWEDPGNRMERVEIPQSGMVWVGYFLHDPERSYCDVEVLYSRNGEEFLPATEGVGSEGTTDLASAPDYSEYHWFVWDSRRDIGPVEEDIHFLIRPSDQPGRRGWSSPPIRIHVNNRDVASGSPLNGFPVDSVPGELAASAADRTAAYLVGSYDGSARIEKRMLAAGSRDWRFNADTADDPLQAVVLVENWIYVAGGTRIEKRNKRTGDLDASFSATLPESSPQLWLAADDRHLYVARTGRLEKRRLSDGGLVAEFESGIAEPHSLVVQGTSLYLSGRGGIRRIRSIDGAVEAAFDSDAVSSLHGLALGHDRLYAVHAGPESEWYQRWTVRSFDPHSLAPMSNAPLLFRTDETLPFARIDVTTSGVHVAGHTLESDFWTRTWSRLRMDPALNPEGGTRTSPLPAASRLTGSAVLDGAVFLAGTSSGTWRFEAYHE